MRYVVATFALVLLTACGGGGGDAPSGAGGTKASGESAPTTTTTVTTEVKAAEENPVLPITFEVPVAAPFAEFPKLVLFDEFNSFDGNTWRKNTFRAEAQYSTSNVTVANSILKITATTPGDGSATSGFIDTRSSGKAFRNGYFEVRARFTGPQNWNAAPLWLWGRNDQQLPLTGGEFDIVEALSRDGGATGEHWKTAHTRFPDGRDRVVAWQNGATDVITGYSGQWHTYGGYWQGNSLRWYRDGKLVRTLTLSDADDILSYSVPMYVMANLWTGTDWVKNAPAGQATLELDWIAVWGAH